MRDHTLASRRALARFMLYVLVGAAGTAAHYAVLFTTVGLGMLDPVRATVLGALVGAVINFVMNAMITFRPQEAVAKGPGQVAAPKTVLVHGKALQRSHGALATASEGHSHLVWSTAARFFATAALAAVANGAAMALLAGVLRLDYRLAQLIVTAVLMCLTYFINSTWTFRARQAH